MNENRFLKFLIIGVILLLVGAISGLMRAYTIFRWDVFGLCAAIILISYTTYRYYWTAVFVGFMVLFNPIVPFSLDRSTWILADLILIGVLLGWFWDYYTSYHKGLLFEHFIMKKFPEPDWVLVNSTKDLHKRLKRFVESDANPDFVFRNKITGKVIAVECKYRSEYFEHKKWGEGITWRKEQGARYLQYGRDNNLSVYVAIGVGGNPKSPKFVSYLPIELIQKQYFLFIPKEVLERNQKLPTV